MKNPPTVIILEDVIEQIKEQVRNENKEFFGFLVGKIKKNRFGKDNLVIEGVAFSPYVASYDYAVVMGFIGTHSGNFSGTVHTHPGAGEIRPSSADKNTFAKFSVNIIANRSGFKVFDSSSREINVQLSRKKPPKIREDEVEKIQNQIMQDAVKREDKEDGKNQKAKDYAMTALKILFVVFVLLSLVLWYFI